MKKIFLKLRLIKSLIGSNKKHRSIILCLGLRKINSFSYVSKNIIFIGMIKKILHFIELS